MAWTHCVNFRMLIDEYWVRSKSATCKRAYHQDLIFSELSLRNEYNDKTETTPARINFNHKSL